MRLLLHRHRLMIGAWLLLLLTLLGGTVWAYQDTYLTPEQRDAAVALARADTATTLLYGELPLPGTPAQMYAWEIGGITTILVSVFAVLLAVALTRAAEDDGTLELIRSCGVDPRNPLRAAVAVLAGVAAALTIGGSVVIGAWAGGVDGVTWLGATMLAAALGLTFLLVSVVTVTLAQLASTAPTARLLGLAIVVAAFGLRAVADVRDAGALNWLSPLALRASIRPFTDDRWWVLGVYLAVAAVLAWLAAVLCGRREYGAGLITRSGIRDVRLPVRSALGLRLRLARRSTMIWTAGVAGLGALFTAMGSGVVEQSRDGDVGGFLGAQLDTTDPVVGYCAYTATLLGMVVSAYAILQVLHHRQDETAGRTGLIVAGGVRRWALLLAQVTAAVAGSAIILVIAAVTGAAIASVTIGGDSTALRMFTYIAGQWPATAVMAASAALLAGIWPRATGLAWLPLLAAGTLALLGPLLNVPQQIRDLGPFQQVADPVTVNADWSGPAVLLLIAATMTACGLAGINRRDLLAG
ncbi:exporter of polyketide antibiotics [Actinoplanes regularis]|nr:exporter of polyketide antibiotics [Actinoplanes regularis]